MVPDYAFCSCNTIGQCFNNNLKVLDLSNNPLATISSTAFENLGLQELYLQNVSIATISLPTPSFTLAALRGSLQILDLSKNQIEYLETNSFNSFAALSNFKLDENPVVGIAPGAFANDPALYQLSFVNFPQLTYIDLLIVYQMPNINSLTITGCHYLSSVILTDASQLPLSLHSINLCNNDIRSIDSQVQYYLQRYAGNKIDFSQNFNFNCNPTIAWMKPFVANYQIANAGSVVCATGEPLTSYLNTLN